MPPKPSHEAKSSQPRFLGASVVVGGGAGTPIVVGGTTGFGGSTRARTGGEVAAAPNSWANVSQLGFFGCSVMNRLSWYVGEHSP